MALNSLTLTAMSEAFAALLARFTQKVSSEEFVFAATAAQTDFVLPDSKVHTGRLVEVYAQGFNLPPSSFDLGIAATTVRLNTPRNADDVVRIKLSSKRI